MHSERAVSAETNKNLCGRRGSVVQLLKDGAVTQEYAYDAYGYINADEFGIQAPFYGYNGEEQNPFTGLQYLRARYYAPQNGGFITQDSFSGVLTNALSQNRYTYAHNNPVNYADPSGHSIWDSIKNGVTNAVNSVKNFVSNVANKVSSAVSSAVNTVKSAVTGTTTKTVANTSSVVKKSYTNTAVRQKIGSYAGGAAAAAAGSVSTSYSNSVVNGVIADSRIPFTNAAGQTVMLPNHFSNMQAAAQAFTKRGCDESLSKISKQQKFSFWDNLINTLEQSINIKSQNQMYSDKANRELLLAFGDTIASSFAAQGSSYVEGAYSQQQVLNSLRDVIDSSFASQGQDAINNSLQQQEAFNTLFQEIFGAGYTAVSQLDSKVYIIPDPSPITYSQGIKNTITVISEGDSSKPISVYLKTRVDEEFLSSGGMKINIGDFNLALNVGLDDIGISASTKKDEITNSFSITANLTQLKVGFESAQTVATSNESSVTTYQNVSVSGIPVYLLYSFLTYGYTSPSQQPVK